MVKNPAYTSCLCKPSYIHVDIPGIYILLVLINVETSYKGFSWYFQTSQLQGSLRRLAPNTLSCTIIITKLQLKLMP